MHDGNQERQTANFAGLPDSKSSASAGGLVNSLQQKAKDLQSKNNGYA